MDDEALSFSAWSVHPRHTGRFNWERDGPLPESRNRCRLSASEERPLEKRIHEKGRHEDDDHGKTSPCNQPQHGGDDEAEVARLSRDRSHDEIS